MTTPRPHAELAARYMADSTLKCWVRDGNSEWELSANPVWHARLEYHVGHAPPPAKRTFTLTVNGRTWVLPEPLKDVNPIGTEYWFRDSEGVIKSARVNHTSFVEREERGEAYATEADAKAWAEFDAWCRGGGE